MEHLFEKTELEQNWGYWGPSTSSVDWCERNYVYTYYIAEFWNTLSSIPISLLGLYGIMQCLRFKYETRYFVSYFLVFMVGLGSMAFHGTLLFEGQMMDELPMIYGSMAYLYIILMRNSQVPNPSFTFGIIVYCIAFTIAYLSYPTLFIFFLLSYALAVTVFGLISIWICFQPQTERSQRILLATTFCSYVGSFVLLWIPENMFCKDLQPFNFHAWFHLSSGLGSYLFLVFATFERFKNLGKIPKLDGLFLPYVNLEAQKYQ